MKNKTICYILIILIMGYLIYKNTENSSKFGVNANPTKTVYLYNMFEKYALTANYEPVSTEMNIYRRVVQTIKLNGNLKFNIIGAFWYGARSTRRIVEFPYEYLKDGDIIYTIDQMMPVIGRDDWYTPQFLIYRDGYVGGYINKQFIPGQNWFQYI